VNFTPAYVSENYDIPLDQFTISKPTAIPTAPPAQFSEIPATPASEKSAESVGQNAIDQAVEDLSPEELQAQAEGLLKPIIAMIDNASDLNSVMEQLSNVYPQMDSTALMQMVERAIFISELLGKATTE